MKPRFAHELQFGKRIWWLALYTGSMLRVPYDELMPRCTARCSGWAFRRPCRSLRAALRRDDSRRRLHPWAQPVSRFAESVANGSVDVNAEPTKTAGWEQSNAGTAMVESATSTPVPPCSEPSLSRSNTASAASPSPTQTTGCAGAAMACRPRSKGCSRFAGPTRWPIFPRGEPRRPRIGNNPLIIAVPAPRRPRRAGHGDVAVFLRELAATVNAASLACRRRLRLCGQSDKRRCGHRGVTARTSHRLLEGLWSLAGTRHACSDALWRPRDLSDPLDPLRRPASPSSSSPSIQQSQRVSGAWPRSPKGSRLPA